MRFRLVYEGTLKPHSSKYMDRNRTKQVLRRYFHSQMSILWNSPPLGNHRVKYYFDQPGDDNSPTKVVKGFHFVPLISQFFCTVTELEILFLRPEKPGSIITQGGDIDNRIKTLIDGLRMPKESEIPDDDSPKEGETPFFCLLEDDNLVTRLSVTTDQLLRNQTPSDVLLIIDVTTRVTDQTWNNFCL
jgi:hypothetical protein